MAMSGGIDSSVAAMLLLEQGYELVGITFRTYDSIRESCLRKEKGCCSIESIMEAKHLAEQLGFPHHILDFRETFRKEIIANFVSEYLNGRTPNPCVLCNSHIKWGELCKAAAQYNCDWIATGHYARIAQHNGHYYLRNAVDTHKDQTYFLWMLTEDNIRHTIFPLGELTKEQVRNIAREHGFQKLSQKAESQEICFIDNNDYRTFIASHAQGLHNADTAFLPGNYIDANGNVLGKHNGFANYTIGQRKGLGIALGTPAYVTHINPDTNEVTLGTHDNLYADTLCASALRLRDKQLIEKNPVVQARIRYKSPAIPATLQLEEPCNLTLQFHSPVWGVTPGQSVVLYQNELLIGGGIINSNK